MTCLLFRYSLLKFSIEMNEGICGASVGLVGDELRGTLEV